MYILHSSFFIFKYLSNHGVLGLNARNLRYIKPFNPRKAVAFADDKLKTKAFLSARGIPTARIYGRIDDHHQLRSFDFSQLPDQCVLKPNYGFGGGGIMVLKGRKNGQFLEQGKRPVSEEELKEHIEDILDGKYSVNGQPDTAFFEKILVTGSAFAPFRPAGLPDIRIVVFNLVPVMSMLRIPTVESHGKANVHLGGIGIGIDIAKGTTTYATQYNKRIHELPHGGSPSGIPIPRWEELLHIASRIQYITNIGYLAVDLTIDAEQGPVLLEVNARAGLMVQVANLAPLRSRLERVAGLKVQTPEKGVSLAQDLFGAKVKSRSVTPDTPERPVLGMRETLIVTGTGTNVEVPSLISPDHERTIFAPDLIQELKKADAIETESADESTYRVKFSLGGKKIQTVVREGRVASASARAMVGRRDIVGFLLDPSKTADSSMVRSTVKEDLRALDKTLSSADEDLMILKHVKPVNLMEEWERAKEDRLYNPLFSYGEPGINLDELEARLIGLVIDDSPIGILFKKKRRELLQRITLIRARGDARRFTEASSSLYGVPTSVLLTSALSALQNRDACELPLPPSDSLTADEAVPFFEKVLTDYGLHDWHVSVREHTIARCTVGGRKVALRAGARFSRTYLPALIAHEIETHVLTAENGDHQPYDLFRRGFANYLDTQEGLAIYNQNRFLTPHHEKRFGPVRNTLAIAYALEHGFTETRRYLQEELGYEPAKALSKSIEIKRGLADTREPGGFTKGIVYYRGLRAIEQYLTQGGDCARLYIGKIALEDLELLERIPGIKAPLLIPAFLREPAPQPAKAGKGKKKGR